MAKRTPIEQLESAVSKILEKYGEDVNQNLQQITKEMARKGAQAVKRSSSSAVGGSGKYASGWTSKIEESRLGITGVIYNATPGLPHLLENGHALRNGGRVPGKTHIKPVEETLVKEFEQEVKSKL